MCFLLATHVFPRNQVSFFFFFHFQFFSYGCLTVFIQFEIKNVLKIISYRIILQPFSIPFWIQNRASQIVVAVCAHVFGGLFPASGSGKYENTNDVGYDLAMHYMSVLIGLYSHLNT